MKRQCVLSVLGARGTGRQEDNVDHLLWALRLQQRVFLLTLPIPQP